MKPLLAFVITAFALPMALPAADAQAGQAAYMKSCKVCHGPQGEGNPAIAKAMNANLPNLGSKAIQAKSDADIRKTVVEGKGKMRPVKTLTAAEIDAAIAYVRTLRKN